MFLSAVVKPLAASKVYGMIPENVKTFYEDQSLYDSIIYLYPIF
jgi:hypothetical protein